MSDIEKLIASVRFKCCECRMESGCDRIVGKRDRIDRFGPDPHARPEVQIYCEHCGATNTLGMDDVGRTNLGGILSSFLR